MARFVLVAILCRELKPSMKKLVYLTLFLLCASHAHAAGGTCPTGANYLNLTTAAPTDSLVTLASLGITNCYYVAANGSDSNSGTTESAPWAHAPYMPNCSGNCLTVQKAFAPGIGIIFRGGDTWHFGDGARATSTGGTLNFNANSPPNFPYVQGTAAHPIYYGVDQTWYSGSSWARPIFTGDNPTSTTAVSSCAYTNLDVNGMVNLLSQAYYILDNFEMTGVCMSSVNNSTMAYLQYGGISGPIWFYNLYFHGWTHTVFGNPNSPVTCTPTTVCTGPHAFYGYYEGTIPSTGAERIKYNIVDGSDSDPTGGNICYCGSWDVAYNYFTNATQNLVRQPHTWHDNVMEYFNDNGHANMLESVGDVGPVTAVYNNILGTSVPTDSVLWEFGWTHR